MNELLLHYVWQQKLFAKNNLRSTNNQSVEVIDVGTYNQHAGPDFFNAKIKIDNLLWAGNVEIHVKASDWFKHNHQNDPLYDRVILHVVFIDDVSVENSTGKQIPQLVIQVPVNIQKTFNLWMDSPEQIKCKDKFHFLPNQILLLWKESLLFEYLSHKIDEIDQLLAKTNYNWDEVFYIQLCKTLGFSVNKQAFESLARVVPYTLWMKYRTELDKLLALFMGQAGWLKESGDNLQLRKWFNDYQFLKRKHQLSPMNSFEWKWLRMRPANFPAVRVFQLVHYLYQKEKLFSFVLDNTDLENCRNLLKIKIEDEYNVNIGAYHKEFKLRGELGKYSIDLLVLNLIAPILFAYGKYRNDEFYINKSVEMYENLPPEKNHIIDMWRSLGVEFYNAFDTQSMINLKKNYCDMNNCLRCRIGHHLLNKNE